MRWRVVVAATAELDAAEVRRWIALESERSANLWLDGLERAVATLETMPRRYRRAPEQRLFGGEVRQFLYHSHRVIYQVDKAEVRVLHIRHAARLPMKRRD